MNFNPARRPQTSESQNPLFDLHAAAVTTPPTSYASSYAYPSPTASTASLAPPFAFAASSTTLVDSPTAGPARRHPLASQLTLASSPTPAEMASRLPAPAPEPWSSLVLFGWPSRTNTAPPERLHYLDTLKLLGALLVLNGTFFSAFLTLPQFAGSSTANVLGPSGALYPFVSQSLGTALLLTLSARSLLSPLYTPHPSYPSSPSHTLLTRSLLLRPFRFLPPILLTALLQWALAGSASHTASLLSNASSWPAPLWGQIRSPAGAATLLWGCFSWGTAKPQVLQAFGSNLYTAPWLWAGSYFALLLFLVQSPLPSTRYYIPLILGPFLIFTTPHLLPALLGSTIADLAAHYQLVRLPFLHRLLISLPALALSLILQFVPTIRLALSDFSLHPASLTLPLADILSASLLLLSIECSSPLTHRLLALPPLKHLSRLALPLALLPPLFTYTFLPTLNASLGVSYITLLACTLALSIPFRLLIEVPPMIAAEWLLKHAMTWGTDGLTFEDVERARYATLPETSEMKELGSNEKSEKSGSEARSRRF